SLDQVVMPLFVAPQPLANEALPGMARFDLDGLLREVDDLAASDVRALLLFGVPAEKDEEATGAWEEDGIVQLALRALRPRFPELVLLTDVCLCEYTSHGHCGVVVDGDVDNDRSLELLARTAVSHAEAGVDIVAPSDMMDGRVGAIREALDDHGFETTPILAYSAKYASAFYGPFREAADSAPAFGDRRGYQMDPANVREALRDCKTDLAEGADALMIKPALPYLDVIGAAREAFPAPLAADTETVAAVRGAALRGTSFGAATEAEVELATEIVDALPSVEKVRLVSSGTEAAMSALRLARAFTKRDRILKTAGGYHGHADALLAGAGSGLATLGIPASPGVPNGAAGDTIVVPYNHPDAAAEAVLRHGEGLAAI